jgi:hypothetical protein
LELPKQFPSSGLRFCKVSKTLTLSYCLNYSFKCLTLRLSYGLVLFVVGLLKGTLQILWEFHGYSP